MLLSKPILSLLVGLSLLSLGACGFEPIYAYKERGLVRDQLEQVKIKSIPDRLGHELHNNLSDILTPRGSSGQPVWELSVRLTESTQKISLKQTSFSTRANLNVIASYDLINLQDQQVKKFTGKSTAISSYNILDSDYANLIAIRDAQSSAVKSLSKDIARQLALWMRDLDK
jgi:LPS-assembly lipoprotein